MMKRSKLILSLLVFIATCCIIGTGYSVWLFNYEKETTEIASIPIEVTPVETMGEFSYILPSVVVLEEGGNSSTGIINGISFYKTETINDKVEVSADNSLQVTFKEKSEIDKEKLELVFGFKIRVYGAIQEYIDCSTDYYCLAEIKNNDYKDLYLFANTINFDGSKNYSYDATERLHTFRFTTQMLNRFFTYKPGKRPSSVEAYTELCNFINDSTKEKSYFEFSLWQGFQTKEG